MVVRLKDLGKEEENSTGLVRFNDLFPKKPFDMQTDLPFQHAALQQKANTGNILGVTPTREELGQQPSVYNTLESGRERIAEQAKGATEMHPSRDWPVIGPVFQALDKVAEVTKPVADVAGQIYTPGAGSPIVGAAYKGAQAGIQRLIPSLAGNSLGQRVAREAITEGALSVPLTAGNTLTHNPSVSGKDLATQTAIGAGLGLLGGAALPAVGAVAGRGIQRLQDNRALNREVKNFIDRTNDPNLIPNAAPAPITRSAEVSRLNTTPPRQDWFTDLFGQQGVGVTPGAKSGKEMIDTHVVSNRKELGKTSDRLGEVISTIDQNYIDKYSPFRQIDNDTYKAAMDSSRANNLATISIRDKMVDLDGNVVGKSLKDVYTNVPRGQKHIADRYSILRDSVSRMDRNIQVFGDKPWFPKTAEEAQKMADDLLARNPWLKQYGDDMNTFNQNRQNLWVQSEIASQEMVDKLRASNPNYIPMQRQQPIGSLKSKFGGNNNSFSGQKAPVKRATGSSRKIIDPAQSLIESTGTSYQAMMRNRAMSKLYNAVKSDPERYRGIVDIVDETEEMKQATLKKLNEALQEDGLEGVVGMLNGELDNIFKKAKQTSNPNDAIVTVMVQGNPVKMKVSDSSLLKAIDGISPEQLGTIAGIADKISRGIKMSATGILSPVQGAKLALRDLPVALAQSKDKRRFIGDVTHALVSQIGDWLPNFIPGVERLGSLARKYYRAGGGYEAYLHGDSKIRAMSADITKDPILSGRNLLKTVRRTGLGMKPLKAFGDALENIPRIAAFKAEMRKNGWQNTPEAIRDAVESAREATVNWSRRGAKGSEIESFLPYSNAAVQGTYRWAKRFKEQPVSATALIMSAAAAKIAAYERFKDDPDYQQRSKYEKGIPIAKTDSGKFVVQPIEPTEGAIADHILNFYKWAMYGEEGPGAKQSIQDTADAFLPKYLAGPVESLTQKGTAFTPQRGLEATLSGSIVEPLTAAYSGRNFFGSDIVPREYQDLPTDLQYNETTSAPGKWAAENLNMDAFTFDYLGQKFGGDIAKIGLPMTSQVGRGDPVGNIWDETLTRLKVLEDPVMKNNISNDFYNMATSVTQAKAANAKKEVSLPEWYQSAYDEVTSTKKGSIASLVSDLNKEKRSIERNPLLSARDRADQLREIQSEINLLRIQGIKRMKELGVPEAAGR